MSSPDGLSNSIDLSVRGRKTKSSPFLLLAVGLLVFATIAGISFAILRPTTLRIAVGPPGSDDQNLIEALAVSFTRDGSPVRLALTTTAGPVDSIALLAASKVDLAVARGDEEMPPGTDSVAILRKNVVVLWTASGLSPKGARKETKSKIKGIDDLAGHRVGVVGRTKVNATLLRVILKESGVDPEKVPVTQFGTDQITEMVHDPNIDAFMTVARSTARSPRTRLPRPRVPGASRSFSRSMFQRQLRSGIRFIESEEIPGSSFSSSPARPDDTIETIGINHLIVAPKSLSDSTVGTFTQQLFAARPLLAREVPSAAKIAKPDTDKDAALPAHPGAAAYIDGNERTFMEKYSDYIWGAVLLLSVLGSASAAVRHYIRRDERRLNTLHREKLLAAISLVRKMNFVEELDRLQCEADEILRETLDCYDDGAIEEGDLAAYSLVLEQFHHAVVDRRTALNEAATGAPRMRAL